MNTILNKSRQSKITHHEQSTGKIESEPTKAVPVRLHKSLTHYLHGFPCGANNEEGKKTALGMGLYEAKANKAGK